jgi:twitching motility protein PilT
MVVTSAISNLIREAKTFRIPSSIQTGKKMGMQLLDEHLFSLYQEGKVSMEDAIDRSQNPGELQEKIEAQGQGAMAGAGAGQGGS